MCKEFSVLIPFRNEGVEVRRTIESVRASAGDSVDVIVLNDCSDDGYDYESDIAGLNVMYHKSRVRIGSSQGKNECVKLCRTPYFLLLDAHCRIYTQDWLARAIELMQHPKSSRTIYCCECWYFNDESDHQSPAHMRGYGGFYDFNIKSLLSCAWNTHNFSSSNEPFDVPCILGANYICSKSWWNEIGGYDGLRLYGREETYISMKSKMCGGDVKCIPSISIGHKTRREGKQPYACYAYEIMHNELVIAYVCLPERFDKLNTVWSSLYAGRKDSWEQAVALFESHKEELEEIRERLNKVKQVDFGEIQNNNAVFQRKVGFNYQQQRREIEGTYPRYQRNEKQIFNIG